MAELQKITFLSEWIFIEDTYWQTVPIWHAIGEHFWTNNFFCLQLAKNIRRM